MINNKKLGTEFENEFCELLAGRGYWVHFISPAANGGQPFDVIAVKGGEAYAYDCKTSVSHIFSINRLEWNQKCAFDRWLKCGNKEPRVAVKYNGRVYIVLYTLLRERGSVNILEDAILCWDLS